jgi:hypothetical protein
MLIEMRNKKGVLWTGVTIVAAFMVYAVDTVVFALESLRGKNRRRRS